MGRAFRLARWALLSIAVVSLTSVPMAPASSPLVANPDRQCLIKVVPPDPTWSLEFGRGVALSGDTMVVGTRSSYDEANDKLSGAVYVYERSAQGWSLQQRIPLTFWTDAVAIDGDRLAVAVSSKIHIWTRAGAVWTREATISLPTDTHVSKLALDRDNLLVAAPFVDDTEAHGAVLAYSRTSSGWSLQQRLTSDSKTRDGFGWNLDVDGALLVVGAHALDTDERQTGSVHVFRRSGTKWSRITKLKIDKAEPELRLGLGVAVQGDKILAGAPGYAQGVGAVYTWVKDGSSWVYSHRVTAPDGSTDIWAEGGGDYFGKSLLVAGDTLVVGSPGDDDRSEDSGSIYLLRWVGARWEHHRKIVPPIDAYSSEFGQHLATDAGRVAVGMVGDSSGAWRSGAVYAFDLGLVTTEGTPLTVQPGKVLVNDVVPDDRSVSVLAAAAPSHGAVAAASGGSLIYKPSAGWKGGDAFSYAISDGASRSNDAKVSVQTWSPSRAYLRPAHATPSFDGTLKLNATVKTRKGSRVANQKVVFQARKKSGIWYSVGSAQTNSTGVATLRLTGFKKPKTFRAYLAWTDTYGADASARVRVKPHVLLSKPSAPTTVRRLSRFRAAGYAKPQLPEGSRQVKLKFYRRQSGSWVLKKSVWANVKDKSVYSVYAKNVSLPSGKWRVRAVRAESKNYAKTRSAYSYIEVK